MLTWTLGHKTLAGYIQPAEARRHLPAAREALARTGDWRAAKAVALFELAGRPTLARMNVDDMGNEASPEALAHARNRALAASINDPDPKRRRAWKRLAAHILDKIGEFVEAGHPDPLADDYAGWADDYGPWPQNSRAPKWPYKMPAVKEKRI